MSIPELLPYVQFFAQVGLVIAAIVALLQFQTHRGDRSDRNTLDILTRLQTPQFRAAYAQIWELPIGATHEQVVEAEAEAAADQVAMTFETLGLMVHKRMVDLEMVDRITGGFLRESWRRLGPYFQEKRTRLHNRRIAEWFQWLAEHLSVDERRQLGAYEAFRKWKP